MKVHFRFSSLAKLYVNFGKVSNVKFIISLHYFLRIFVRKYLIIDNNTTNFHTSYSELLLLTADSQYTNRIFILIALLHYCDFCGIDDLFYFPHDNILFTVIVV